MRFLAVRRLAKLSHRVKRGAALFDVSIAGWAFDVDLDRLDMRGSGCVLHQLGRSDLRSLGLGFFSVARYGFDVTLVSALFGRSDEDYQALTLLWAAEIIARRRKAAARRLVASPKVNTPVLV